MGGVADRRHPRFVTSTRVEIRTEDRGELRALWTENISKGGLFVRTEEPPPMRARVEVQLETPDGAITLSAEVVHQIDAAAAANLGHPAGVGLQFVNLSPEVRARIERYVDGLAARLREELAPPRQSPSLDAIFDRAKRCLTALEASDLYGALELDPTVTGLEITERLDELRAFFSAPPPETPPPKRARLEALLRQLERLRHLLLDDERRRQYNERRGLARPPSSEPVSFEDRTPPPAGTEHPPNVKQAELRNQMGLVMLRKADFRAARDLFSEAMKLDPKPLEYRAHYAWTMLADARFDRQEAKKQARPLLERAVSELTIENTRKRRLGAVVYFYMGRLLKEEGDLDAAKEYFRKAQVLDDHHLDAAREYRLLSARVAPKNER